MTSPVHKLDLGPHSELQAVGKHFLTYLSAFLFFLFSSIFNFFIRFFPFFFPFLSNCYLLSSFSLSSVPPLAWLKGWAATGPTLMTEMALV
jgi:hypothetical protein